MAIDPEVQIVHSSSIYSESRLDLGFGNINPTRACSQCRLPKVVFIKIEHSAVRYLEFRLDLKFVT